MHRLAALILLLAFLGQTFDQGVCYVGYVVNKAEYLRNCENKYRPLLQCNGKCQLMKKIEAQRQKEEQQAPELKLVAKAEVVSSKSSFLINPPGIIREVSGIMSMKIQERLSTDHLLFSILPIASVKPRICKSAQ